MFNRRSEKEYWAYAIILVLGAIVGVGIFIHKANYSENAALFKAIRSNDIVKVRQLLQNEDRLINPKKGYPPIFEAIRYSRIEILKLLISKGADVNLKGDRLQYSSIFIPSEKGDTDTIRILFDAGADLNLTNRLGETPLIYASKAGKREAVKLLIKLGADVNKKDNSYKSAVDYAIKNNFYDIAKFMLINGANLKDESLKIKILKNF